MNCICRHKHVKGEQTQAEEEEEEAHREEDDGDDIVFLPVIDQNLEKEQHEGADRQHGEQRREDGVAQDADSLEQDPLVVLAGHLPDAVREVCVSVGGGWVGGWVAVVLALVVIL